MGTDLEEYLSYYCGLDRPEYAVLVTGEWGVGKTFQVKACIPESERYYVSLFGLSSIEQVHSLVLAAAYPKSTTAKNFLSELASTGKDAGGLFALGGLLPGVFEVAYRQTLRPDRTLIFDDLERSALDIQDRLGVINTYVEQYGFRVVVIAHDERLAQQFGEAKEKVFGQTIRVQPRVEEAFNTFLARTAERDKEAAAFIRERATDVLETFAEGRSRSLRILRHVVEDLSRVYRSLDKLHLQNAEAMRELVRLFSAFDIEVRSGCLGPSDLQDRANVKMMYDVGRYGKEALEEEAKPPFVASALKFKSVALDSNLLSDQVLHTILVEGRYPTVDIRACLDRSGYFLQAAEVQPWQVLIKLDEMDDGDVQNAKEKMLNQFENRELTNSGDMLHMFALMIMMAHNRILELDVKTATENCIAYIDDLLAAGRLPPRGTDWRWYDEFEHGYRGQGYWTAQTEVPFQQVWDHLIRSREQALERQFPQLAESLLTLMKTDGQKFFRQVCYTNIGDSPYVLIPVLSAIRPKDFVDAWLGSSPHQWHWIRMALNDRYEGARVREELSKEREWAVEVHNLLQAEANAATAFKALRIRRTIPASLISLAKSVLAEREAAAENED